MKLTAHHSVFSLFLTIEDSLHRDDLLLYLNEHCSKWTLVFSSAYKNDKKLISSHLLHAYTSVHQHIVKTSVTSNTTNSTTHAHTTTSENTIKHAILSTETTGYTL